MDKKKNDTVNIIVKKAHYLVFELGDKAFALPLEAVRRVVHAVYVTLLPKTPEIVCGIINYKGEILPVIDISKRFLLSTREIEPDRHFIIVNAKNKSYCLLGDDLIGVTQIESENIVSPSEIIAGVEFLSGVIKLQDGIMLIPDLEHILTYEEEKILNSAVHKKDTGKDAS